MDSEFTMLVVLLLIACVLIRIVRTAVIKGKINKLADNALEVTPEEFFRIRNSSNGGRGKKHISTKYDFTGIYILFNHTKNMYYVGQGKKVFQRVNNHFK